MTTTCSLYCPVPARDSLARLNDWIVAPEMPSMPAEPNAAPKIIRTRHDEPSPERIADATRRLPCPRCEATVTRHPVGAVQGRRRIKARCSDLDCYWSRLIEIDDEKRCRRLRSRSQPRLFASLPPSGPRSPKPAPTTDSGCLVPNCRASVAEHQMCSGHLVFWRLAGSPENIEAWALIYAIEHRLMVHPDRNVPVTFRPTEKREEEEMLTDEEHERMFGSETEEPFEV